MSKSGLGRAIINKIEKKKYSSIGSKAPIFVQQSQENQQQKKKAKLKSVLEQNSLSQFLQVAQISGRKFEANRNIKFKQIRQEMKNKKIVVGKQAIEKKQADQSLIRGLQLPKRPAWDNMTKQQLQKSQSAVYIKWRQNLARVEQSNDIHITPYEKNIEVWRQLWRVVERSDLLVQIVDARDPLFFWSEDLFDYAKDLSRAPKSKNCVLLINKSDLVEQQTITRWSHYLKNQNINHLFFSAKPKNPQTDTSSQIGSQATKEQSQIGQKDFLRKKFLNQPKVLLPQQLTAVLTQFGYEQDKIEIGMVGYPNVGKSSIINTIVGKKKVGVANMPGKTKHFQTLILNNKVTLCDCPGLVFPKVSVSVAHMVLNGLYPLDTIKKYIEPIQLLLQRVPREKIIKQYGLHWKQDDVYSAENVLCKYSQMKGFFGGSGLPNQAVASRQLLKDYVSGNLVYAQNPPDYVEPQNNEQKKPINPENMFKKRSPPQIESQNAQIMAKNIERQVDKEFFQQVQKDPRHQQNEQQLIEMLQQEDLLDLIQGKKVGGLKVTKEARKAIKHALKRGQKLQTIKKNYLQSEKSNVIQKTMNKK